MTKQLSDSSSTRNTVRPIEGAERAGGINVAAHTAQSIAMWGVACGRCGGTYTVKETYIEGVEYCCRNCGRSIEADGSEIIPRLGVPGEGEEVLTEKDGA